MFKGGYELQTSSRELIDIHSEKLNMKVEGEIDWTLITKGMNFNVQKNSSFCLDVIELVNYAFSYFTD